MTRAAYVAAASVACAAAAAIFAACSDDEPPSPVTGADGGAGGDATTAPDAAYGDASEDARGDAGPCAQDAAAGPPDDLACTGLYSDPATKTVAATARAYTPGLAFWSDGAEKSRWIELPAGAQIDTSDVDEWVFPVGTKVWKEFRLGGKRIETRLFWKRAPGTWSFTTYRWSADEARATRLDTGAANVVGTYEIPPVAQCDACHSGHADRLLGFEALSLGLPTASGVTLASLVAEGRLTKPPAVTSFRLPDDPSGTAGPALGFLHANCGNVCHNANAGAFAAETGLFMRLYARPWVDGGVPADAAPPVDASAAYVTAVNQPISSAAYASYASAGYLRITPGSSATSLVPTLDGMRGAGQMPPFATHEVDDAGVSAVRAWIDQGAN